MSSIDSILGIDPVIGWAVAGALLLILEILQTTRFFIPFSAAAFAISVLTFFKLLPMGILWQGVVFAILGVLLIPVSRRLLQRFFEDKPDINRY
jgi:membrane protein implicated in regulation of membrane protease activity